MGREIRRVPANYKHPQKLNERTGDMDDASMYDRTFEQATAEWDAEWAEWQAGVRPDYFDKTDENDATIAFFSEWHGLRPNDPSEYRQWSDEDATWFQVWQTVSEGSPTTPPFATIEELTTYLADHGDGVDQFGTAYAGPTFGQRREPQAWGRARAEAFTNSGYAPSLAVINGEVLSSRDVALALSDAPATTA